MPDLVIIGGPNGAGKSTILPALDSFPRYFNSSESSIDRNALLNPDKIAGTSLDWKTFLRRRAQLLDDGSSFAVETTLSGRGYANLMRRARDRGYRIYTVFLNLASPDLAVARVRRRVLAGGHDVAEEKVRRHFDRGLPNFFRTYRWLSDFWVLANNSDIHPVLIAWGYRDAAFVRDSALYEEVLARLGSEDPGVTRHNAEIDTLSDEILSTMEERVRSEIRSHAAGERMLAVWRNHGVHLVPASSEDIVRNPR
jgi:predicted ABC-type ATPase